MITGDDTMKKARKLRDKVLDKSSHCSRTINNRFVYGNYVFNLNNIYADNEQTIIHFELYSTDFMSYLLQFVVRKLAKFMEEDNEDDPEFHCPLILDYIDALKNLLRLKTGGLFSPYLMKEADSETLTQIRKRSYTLHVLLLQFDNYLLEADKAYVNCQDGIVTNVMSFPPLPEKYRKDKKFSLSFRFAFSQTVDGGTSASVSYFKPAYLSRKITQEPIIKIKLKPGIENVRPIVRFDSDPEYHLFEESIAITGLYDQNVETAYSLAEKLEKLDYLIQINFDRKLDEEYFTKPHTIVLLQNKNDEADEGYIHLWNEVIRLDEVEEKVEEYIKRSLS